MKIGYLMNSYPITSTTFIRREIAAHEAAGAEIRRYAIRHWGGRLVEPADIAERDRTEYLLTGQGGWLIFGLLGAAVSRPRSLFRAMRALWALQRRAGGGAEGMVRHTAYLLEAIRLRKLSAQDGISHIHAHFSTNPAAVAMLARLMGGPSYSFTVHGPDELFETAAISLETKVRHAAFVVAISDYCRSAVQAASDPADAEKIRVVRCGVDLDDFRAAGPDPAIPAGQDPGACAKQTSDAPLLCVGRLCWQKAQTLLVDAAALLKDTHPELRILLIGDGDARGEIEAKIAEHGLEENIILHGWGTGAEVKAAMAGARALVLPSLAEGLPVVIMEALAMGRPVISTRIAGIPELVDADCGWIVEPGDVPALAAAIADCLSRGAADLDSLGRAGRSRLAALHDQTENAALLRDHITQVAPGMNA